MTKRSDESIGLNLLIFIETIECLSIYTAILISLCINIKPYMRTVQRALDGSPTSVGRSSNGSWKYVQRTLEMKFYIGCHTLAKGRYGFIS